MCMSVYVCDGVWGKGRQKESETHTHTRKHTHTVSSAQPDTSAGHSRRPYSATLRFVLRDRDQTRPLTAASPTPPRSSALWDFKLWCVCVCV